MRNNVVYPLIFLALGFVGLAFTEVYAQTASPVSAEVRVAQDGENGDYVKGITPGRARSLVGGVLALLGVVIGWRARRRSDNGRKWTVIAFALGCVAIVLSVVHLANNTGGFGTGGGKAGAIVAIVLGAAGVVTSIITLRSKRQSR